MAAVKKKKTEKKTYTYEEYVKKLRPKSLGHVKDSEVNNFDSLAEPAFHRKQALPEPAEAPHRQ